MSGPDTGRPQRFVPNEPFPPYAYVTGRFPHPTRDPSGHSFGHRPSEPPPLTTENWSISRAYLLGCDLFNYGYYWEAHEVWEGLWQACGRRGTTADFLKGLIKLAAAGVKAREGRLQGVARHAARAEILFRGVRSQIASRNYLGLNTDWLMELSADLPRHVMPLAGNAPVEIAVDFHLLPAADDK